MVCKISGKICVVFGGSSGIGKAVCRVFAERGAKVVVVGRDGEKALETAQSLREISTTKQYHFSCDITDSTLVQKTISKIESSIGGVNILVNAAGVNKDSLLLVTKTSDIENIISTNLLGSIHTCKAVLKSMVRRREGSIVNIGSVVGLRGNTGQSIYSASKSGLVGFTKSLAKEVAPKGVQVNLVAPGLIETRMTDELHRKSAESYKSLIPLGRFGKPMEIAHCICFLVQSSYITGQVVVIDGGLHLAI